MLRINPTQYFKPRTGTLWCEMQYLSTFLSRGGPSMNVSANQLKGWRKYFGFYQKQLDAMSQSTRRNRRQGWLDECRQAFEAQRKVKL